MWISNRDGNVVIRAENINIVDIRYHIKKYYVVVYMNGNASYYIFDRFDKKSDAKECVNMIFKAMIESN